MGLIGFLVFGLFVGAVARLLLPGRQKIGIAMTLLLGVIGSIVGGIVANAIGSGDIFELNIFGSIVAIAASVALLAVAESAGIGAPQDRDRIER